MYQYAAYAVLLKNSLAFTGVVGFAHYGKFYALAIPKPKYKGSVKTHKRSQNTFKMAPVI